MGEYYSLKDFKSLDKEEDINKIHECINKIMGTLAFRKLAGKTQVILSINGPNIRTRLTHTMEVSRIAKDICRALDLNADLAEAISLAHDIGHTPFGHVGERTLREIMCGCDTLDGKISDEDFKNAGFKHNLQSFRVLKDIEQIVNDKDYSKVWQYILWGVLFHTKLTYAKISKGRLEDDIFISGYLCKQIFNCYFSSNHKCHRNHAIRVKKKANNDSPDKYKLCKAWYCAILKEENDEFKEYVYCDKQCYLAKLWKTKIDQCSSYRNLHFMFDHPFPNIFYAGHIDDYFFNGEHEDWVSLEACVVRQADEIAQLQQDLEDAITKNLITIEDSLTKVEGLLNQFKTEKEVKELHDEIIKEKKKFEQEKVISTSINVQKLGEIISKFYKHILQTRTRKNVSLFLEDKDMVRENIYILMDYIYIYYMNCNENKDRKRRWLLSELQQLNDSKKTKNIIQGTVFFDLRDSEYKEERHALYEIVYDFLDGKIKSGESVVSDHNQNYDFYMMEKLICCIMKNDTDFIIRDYTDFPEQEKEIKWAQILSSPGLNES